MQKKIHNFRVCYLSLLIFFWLVLNKTAPKLVHCWAFRLQWSSEFTLFMFVNFSTCMFHSWAGQPIRNRDRAVISLIALAGNRAAPPTSQAETGLLLFLIGNKNPHKSAHLPQAVFKSSNPRKNFAYRPRQPEWNIEVAATIFLSIARNQPEKAQNRLAWTHPWSLRPQSF